jgi:hypothetical protein
MASDTRIVLVKPGDVLMLGNVALPELASDLDAFHAALSTLRETLSLEHICVFEDDIDLAVKPTVEVRHEVHVQAPRSVGQIAADAYARALALARNHVTGRP